MTQRTVAEIERELFEARKREEAGRRIMPDHSHNEISGHNPKISKKMLFDHLMRDHFGMKQRLKKANAKDYNFHALVAWHMVKHSGNAPEYREEI